MTMADTIAVMHSGRVEQLGSPRELYERPVSRYVANFLGQSNCLDGTVVEVGGDTTVVDVHGVRLALPGRHGRPGAAQSFGVRPEKAVVLARTGGSPDPRLSNGLPGVVTDVSFTGLSIQYVVRTGWGQDLAVFAQNDGADAAASRGDAVLVAWRPEHAFALRADVPAPADEPASVLATASP